MPYSSKPPTSVDDQIKHLLAKGLIISDEVEAKQVLTTIDYYRLKGFMLGLRDLSAPYKPFLPGVRFEDIAELAETDHRIRLVIFSGVQRLEPMIRTALTTELCADHGSAWYADSTLFKSKVDHAETLSNWLRGFKKQRRRELYVKHFETKYGYGNYPPSWMMLETVTIGGLSRVYYDLKSSPAKSRIANHFGQVQTVCVSWLHSVSHLRNVVAHRGRIWNGRFSIQPLLSGVISAYGQGSPIRNNWQVAAQVYVLFRLLKAVDPVVATFWMDDFKTVMAGLDSASLEINGFEPEWASHPEFN